MGELAKDCVKEYCECTHTVTVELGQVRGVGWDDKMLDISCFKARFITPSME